MIFGSDNFVEVDVILRKGGHINRSDIVLFEFIYANYEELHAFYDRYQCSLVQHPDGFFFLTPMGNMLQSRQLSKSCMHLGMFIALKMRDPEITRSSGKLTISQLLQSIETSIPRETLQSVYAPKHREASQDQKITEEIMRALRILEGLRFLTIQEGIIRPTEAINRFAELARHNNEPDETTREALLGQRGVIMEGTSETALVPEEEDNEPTDR